MLQSVSNTINPRKTSDKGHDPYTSATTSLMYVCLDVFHGLFEVLNDTSTEYFYEFIFVLICRYF